MPEDMQTELLRGFGRLTESISDQSAKIGELVGEMRAVNASHMEVKEVVADHEKRIRAIEIEDAKNEPTMEVTKSIFAKVREYVIGAAIAAAAAYVSIKK